MYCTKCKMTYPDDGEWDVCPECDVKLITNKERDELNRIETAAKTNALYESLKSEYAKKGSFAAPVYPYQAHLVPGGYLKAYPVEEKTGGIALAYAACG